MEFQKFCDYVKDNILKEMPEEYQGAEVSIDETIKNNSVILHGLSIHRDDKNIAARLYLEYAYDSYKDEKSVDEIVQIIAKEYVKHDMVDVGIDAESIFDFDNVKDKITTQILNGKQNKALAAIRPCKKLDDLLVFYRITHNPINEASACIPITNEMMKMWGVTTQDIHNLAVENTERLFPSELVDIEDILFGTEENFFEATDEKPDGKLLVLKNKEYICGASAIANPDVLCKVADVVKEDFYILPASVNEVLILSKESAKEMGKTPKDLGIMVRDVNKTKVRKDEVLSDHVYVYDREKKVIETVMDSKDKSKEVER